MRRVVLQWMQQQVTISGRLWSKTQLTQVEEEAIKHFLSKQKERNSNLTNEI